MQEVKREVLVSKASELLKNGTVDRVLGWKAGEFDYDITPAVFHTSEELEQDFVWNDFCGANFSKYLVSETGKSENKILVFLKPCDTYSFNQLLTEHRFDREKVYAVGVGCNGMLDVAKQLKDRNANRVFVCTTFGLFTDGLKKFDEYYEKGYIHKVITTDLNYHTPELLDRPYYEPAAMGKYLASIMDTLNHDVSVEKVRSTTSKITKLLAKNREEKK